MRIGLGASAVERISYAALLHDLGELSEELVADSGGARHVKSADIVRDVEFFNTVEPILRACEGGEQPLPSSEDDLLAALIVSLASDIDAAASPEVAAAHQASPLDGIAARVPPAAKAQVVGAAIELGYRIPAVG